MNYKVTFTQNYTYEVTADSEDEAYNKAHKEFVREMCYPVANTLYDYLDIECEDEDED